MVIWLCAVGNDGTDGVKSGRVLIEATCRDVEMSFLTQMCAHVTLVFPRGAPSGAPIEFLSTSMFPSSASYIVFSAPTIDR